MIGYEQHFDVEGDSGIVARASGTVCLVTDLREHVQSRADQVDSHDVVVRASSTNALLVPSLPLPPAAAATAPSGIAPTAARAIVRSPRHSADIANLAQARSKRSVLGQDAAMPDPPSGFELAVPHTALGHAPSEQYPATLLSYHPFHHKVLHHHGVGATIGQPAPPPADASPAEAAIAASPAITGASEYATGTPPLQSQVSVSAASAATPGSGTAELGDALNGNAPSPILDARLVQAPGSVESTANASIPVNPAASTSTASSSLVALVGGKPVASLPPPPTRSKKFIRRGPGLEREVALLTLRAFPLNLRVRLGAVVSARSVKFLGRLAAKIADQETRDEWWTELREEVRSHARALHCNYVVGYREMCVVYDDVCVLSATGTAAVLREPKPAWMISRDSGAPIVPAMGSAEQAPSGTGDEAAATATRLSPAQELAVRVGEIAEAEINIAAGGLSGADRAAARLAEQARDGPIPERPGTAPPAMQHPTQSPAEAEVGAEAGAEAGAGAAAAAIASPTRTRDTASPEGAPIPTPSSPIPISSKGGQRYASAFTRVGSPAGTTSSPALPQESDVASRDGETAPIFGEPDSLPVADTNIPSLPTEDTCPGGEAVSPKSEPETTTAADDVGPSGAAAPGTSRLAVRAVLLSVPNHRSHASAPEAAGGTKPPAGGPETASQARAEYAGTGQREF